MASTMKIHLVLCLFVMGFCSTINFPVVTGNCLADQQSLLLQLRTSLQFSPKQSTKLVQWNQSENCCEWNGVTCRKGRVTTLDLSQEGIYGVNDNFSSLFSLQYLHSLNLADNLFHTKIPYGFHKLSNLRHLNLSYAGFSGQIPVDISKLNSLVTLDLSSYRFYLILDNPNLLMLVQNKTYMTTLVLEGTLISAFGNGWFQALSSSMPNLQVLNLAECNISGTINSSLANFNNLTILDLSSNQFNGRFPNNIFQLKGLKYLDVSYNFNLYGSLPNFLQNGSLQSLKIALTNFSGPIPHSISNLMYLSTLDLSLCHFRGRLPNSMSKLAELTNLDLSINIFNGPIPSFNLSKKLIYMDLSYNDFNGTIPSTQFQGLVNLVHINLRGNSFKGSIPSSIFTLPFLQQILLSGNKFDGQLNDLTNISRLQELRVSNNQLDGPIPSSVFDLPELKSLDLSSNKFSGKIELNLILKLRNLTELSLSENNLSCTDTATIFSSFSYFPKVEILGLASCGLTKFPVFLRNQSELQYLDLSNNNIQGVIPIWIWNRTSLYYLDLSENNLTNWEECLHCNTSHLEFLDLHSNHLQRPLPVLFLLNLTYLDCSINNISSVIPFGIDDRLPAINILLLSSNRFFGSIPDSICNLTILQVLEISNNFLTGTIPKCLVAMETLRVLKLRSNNLNGSILDASPSSCKGLLVLDVNGNLLHGKFPKYLVNCSCLEILDLGNNQINDKFPCRLKNIPTLYVLILRSNKLHGSIECPSTQAAWPTIQIVDLAMNNLTGRIQPEFFKTWKEMMVDDKLKKPYTLRLLVLYKTYYGGGVTITSKQQQIELLKIQTIFTCVDLSSNKFEGKIPEEIGLLKALHILNLSHNVISGHIPSSLGNLKDLESLDLSNNFLSGEIPSDLASLSFLSFLDVSYNHLVGRIPTSTQLQSFNATLFRGNEGLCGPPLTENCNGDGVQWNSPPLPENSHSSIEWKFISPELGFIFGIAMITLPLTFSMRYRLWYWKHVDAILYRIFPQLDFVYEKHGEKRYRTLRWKP